MYTKNRNLLQKSNFRTVLVYFSALTVRLKILDQYIQNVDILPILEISIEIINIIMIKE